MSTESSQHALDTRLDHLEDRIEALHSKLDTSTKGGGGIGCLGVALFVFLFMKLDTLLDAVEALSR